MTDTIIITLQDEIEYISTVENGGVIVSPVSTEPIVIFTTKPSDIVFSTDNNELETISIIEQGPQGIPGIAGNTVLQYVAGINLSGHRMVIVDIGSEVVIYADSTIPSHATKVLGMTTGAAMLGNLATIRTSGELTEVSWNWDLSLPIWLGINGLLTQVIPSVGFSLIIGFPITATKIYIDIREPIFLI